MTTVFCVDCRMVSDMVEQDVCCRWCGSQRVVLEENVKDGPDQDSVDLSQQPGDKEWTAP